jgi:hypothetical protein
VQAAAALTVEDMLRHIHYYRIHDYVEQIALLNTLPAFLKEHPEVRCLLLGIRRTELKLMRPAPDRRSNSW